MKAVFLKQSFEVLTKVGVYSMFSKDLELAGRVCYKSEDRISNGSAEKFIKGLIKSGHESVLEHSSLSLRIITDRATGNALVRHRHCAFSQESTHYINYGKRDEVEFIDQDGFELSEEEKAMSDSFRDWWTDRYSFLSETDRRYTRQFIPLGFKTEIIMTTNLREWRTILKLRTSDRAHPQMRSLMLGLLEWFRLFLPEFVTDIEV